MAVEHRPDIPPVLFDLIECLFVGMILALVLYGMTIKILESIFRTFFRKLFEVQSQQGNYRVKRTYKTYLPLIYAVLIFIFGTVYITTNTILLIRAVLYNPLYPQGGPFAFIRDNYDVPYVVVCNTFFELTIWLADAFMLYRCMVIYSGIRWALVFPGFLYLCSVVSGIFLLIQSSRPESSLYSNVNFGLVNFSLAAGLNVLIAAMISGRLIYHRQRVRRALGTNPGYLHVYTSITTIVVESSALYAIFSILFIVPFAKEHPLSQVFLPVLGQIQVISPLLVILRLAKQTAWTAAVTVEASTGRDIRFSHPRGPPAYDGSTNSQILIRLEVQQSKKTSEPLEGSDHDSEETSAQSPQSPKVTFSV